MIMNLVIKAILVVFLASPTLAIISAEDLLKYLPKDITSLVPNFKYPDEIPTPSVRQFDLMIFFFQVTKKYDSIIYVLSVSSSVWRFKLERGKFQFHITWKPFD